MLEHGQRTRPNAKGGAARFRDLRNVGGAPDFDYFRNRTAGRDDYYAEQLYDGDSFLYGGPGGC